jgi:hypothetical protein
MNRRDFLTLRTGPRGRTLELSGERLYMRCLDAGLAAESESVDDVWNAAGEPAAVLDRRTPGDLFRDIADNLTRVDTLRVIGRQWLSDNALSKSFDDLVESFVARGGRVEFLNRSTGS